MFKYFSLTIFYLIVFISPTLSAQTFNLAKFSIGKSRIKVELNDFIIHYQNSHIEANWISNSVQWIRNENNLLVPRALLKIRVKPTSILVHINYRNNAIFPVQKHGASESLVYVDLFYPENILIYSGSELLDKIVIEAAATASARSKQLIDYSCSPYELKIDGIDSEYLSVGCKMQRLGHLGSETPRLEVTMSTTNLKTLNGDKAPYTIFLDDNSPVEIIMKGIDEKIKHFRLSAKLPTRLNRFKTSFGFGPYIYESQENQATQNSNFAPSLMIYGKYELNDTASFKAFDALLYSKSFFNNSGMYFSYDLAEAFDGRLYLNALLGFQGLHYQYSKNDKTVFRLLYPQGFEVFYKHAFIENYTLTYGMFVSTSSEKYTNTWLRYGKSTFLELNYINWQYNQSKIKMWGLSIGIPIFSAL